MHEYLEAEKAVIDKLADMKTAGIIKTLAPYAGELDDAVAKILTGMTNLAPFVYIDQALSAQGQLAAWMK